jgi:hypothetical protein
LGHKIQLSPLNQPCDFEPDASVNQVVKISIDVFQQECIGTNTKLLGDEKGDLWGSVEKDALPERRVALASAYVDSRSRFSGPVKVCFALPGRVAGSGHGG